MQIKKYDIKLMYMMYFILSGTAIKAAKYFVFFDVIFLIIIPLILFLSYLANPILNNVEKKGEKNIVIMLFLFYLFQILIFSKNLNYILNEILYIIPNGILYFYIYEQKEIELKDYKKFIYMITLFLVTTLIDIDLRFLGIDYTGFSHYKKGIFDNSVGVGMFSLLGYYLIDLSIEKKYQKFIFQLFFITILIFSNTRGCLIALLFYIIFSKGVNIGRIIKTLLGVGTLTSIGIFAKIIDLNKIFNKYGSNALDLLTGRPAIWKISIEYFMKENVFGEGIGHYNIMKKLSISGYSPNVHNSYLDIILSSGIYIGIIILGFILMKVIRFIIYNKKITNIEEKVLYDKNVGIIISILILNLSESTIFFTRTPIAFIFWNILGELNKKIEIKA